MKRCKGNEKVGAGLYMNVGGLSFKAMDKEGVLPGNEADTYYRVPALAMLVAGPVLGAAYVMFLPCVGFGMVLWTLGEKAASMVGAGEAASRVMKPTWHPTMAFLSKNKAKKGAGAREAKKEEWAENVERELDDEE